MSSYKRKQSNDINKILLASFGEAVNTHRGLGKSHAVASLESFDESMQDTAAASFDDAEAKVRESVRQSIAESEEIDVADVDDSRLADMEAGIEAATMVLMGHDNLSGFRDKSSRATAGDLPVAVSISGSFGNLSPVAAVEGFDVNAIDTFKSESISYNLQAPRQDAFAEMFYPTYVGTPDQAMFKAGIDRVMIAPRVEHTLDGEAKHFGKRNVLEAFRNAEILDDNSTDLVPVVDDSNKDKFVPVTVKPNNTVEVNGHSVTTRPLVVGKKIGLIGISSNPGLIAAGLMDQNESVDHNAGIASVIVKISKDGAEDEYVEVNTLRHASAKFVKTPQGHGFDMRSNLRVEHIFRKDFKTTSGGDTEILKALIEGEKQLTISIGADTDLNLERGNISLSPRAVEAVLLRDSTGKELTISEATELEGVTFEIVGYEVDARRTNSTRRSAGHRVDVDRWEEVYPVGLLAPIVAQDPTSPYSKDSKMKALVQATHVKINNAAVTALLNTAEHLEQVVDQLQHGFVTADSETGGMIEGIARMVMKPHFRKSEIDLPSVINNVSSKDKLRDVQGHFIGVINEIGYRMVQNTGYRIAARALNGGIEKDVELLIGTDEVLPAFMMIQGDDRTAGIKLKHRIESSSDQRMFGKVVIALGSGGTGFQPLHFGNFLWIPELVSEIPVNRNGTTIRETMVQPRFRHICNTPAMEVIEVKGLQEVLNNRTALKVEEIQP